MLFCYLIFIKSCGWPCSQSPNANLRLSSAKDSFSCKLPIHLGSTKINDTAHQAEKEAQFKLEGGLWNGMGDRSTLQTGYGGLADSNVQGVLRAQGLYNGLTPQQMRAGLVTHADYNNAAEETIKNHLIQNGDIKSNLITNQIAHQAANELSGMNESYKSLMAINNLNQLQTEELKAELNRQQTDYELAAIQLKNALSMEDGKNGLASVEMQEVLNREQFKNDQNFENLKHFQNYSERIKESTKETKNTSTSKDLQLKFTSHSESIKVENYIKVLSFSKVFLVDSVRDQTVYVNLISTTQFYHPQFRIYEKKGNLFVLMQNLNNSNTFFLMNKGMYVLEVGTKSESTEPFQNFKTGEFEIVISSEIRTISNILNEEGVRVQIYGYEGMAPFTHGSGLILFHDSWKYLNFGILNYAITPYYDIIRRTLTVYYNTGSTSGIGKTMRATSIEIKCNKRLHQRKTYVGTEPRPGMYHFDVESNRICDLFDHLE